MAKMRGLAYKREMNRRKKKEIARTMDSRLRCAWGTESFEDRREAALESGWGQPGKYLKTHFCAGDFPWHLREFYDSWSIADRRDAEGTMDELKENGFPLPGRVCKKMGSAYRVKGSGGIIQSSASEANINEFQRLLAEASGDLSKIPEVSISVAPAGCFKDDWICPTVTVKKGDELLVEDTDYTLEYFDNYHAGTAKVKICGIGKYSGSVIRTFPIRKAFLHLTVSVPTTRLQIGQSEAISVVPSLQAGISYHISAGSAASVDARGLVTGRSKGLALVKITADPSGDYEPVSRNILIKVEEPLPQFSVEPYFDSLILKEGEALTVTVSFGGPSLSDCSVSLSCSGDGISAGWTGGWKSNHSHAIRVTGKAAGTYTLTYQLKKKADGKLVAAATTLVTVIEKTEMF